MIKLTSKPQQDLRQQADIAAALEFTIKAPPGLACAPGGDEPLVLPTKTR